MVWGVPSKTQVDKAGALLRDWFATDRMMGDAESEAIATVWAFRQSFAYPMTKVSANLRYYVGNFNEGDIVVAQRHKRLPRIIHKLHRQQRMRLSQMQDVGGCRAVVATQQAAYGVLHGIERNWDVVRVDDYVSEPRPTGYRAIHAIVRRDGCAVEVQLRTDGQQVWADEVERLDGRTPYLLKDGEGPDDALVYTRELAELIATVDSGRAPAPERLTRLRRLRVSALTALRV
mgnify:CR=1 FL=1